MSTSNKIGVVLATFNGQQFIKEQLQSIINQTLRPDTIIISDGGSTDDTVNICEEFLSRSGIVYKIYTSVEPLNVRENFQKGLSLCDTDYIFFSDQDDYWEDYKIETMMDAFKIEGVKLVFSNSLLVDQNLKSLDQTMWDHLGYKQDSKIRVYDKNSKNYLSIQFRHNIITGMCMAITSEVKNAVIPFSIYGIHDDWIALVSGCLGKIAALNYNLVRYRQHSHNTIGTSDSLLASFRRRGIYYDSILNRLNFTETVLSFHKKHNGTNIDMIQRYLDYLQFRLEYMKRKHNIFSILSLRRKYIKYENRYKPVILKDAFIHIFNS